jgi:hypothetical protein
VAKPLYHTSGLFGHDFPCTLFHPIACHTIFKLTFFFMALRSHLAYLENYEGALYCSEIGQKGFFLKLNFSDFSTKNYLLHFNHEKNKFKTHRLDLVANVKIKLKGTN